MRTILTKAVVKTGLTMVSLGLLLLVLFPLGDGSLSIAAKRKVQLEVWGLPGGTTTIAYETLAKKYEKVRPDVKVNTLRGGFGVEDSQKLLTAISAGVGPDIVFMVYGPAAEFVFHNTMLPLDDLIAKSDINREDYFPELWNACTYHGRIYSLPSLEHNIFGLFWNRKLFREAGLDPEAPPKYWDELLAYTKKLTKFDSQGRMIQSGVSPFEWPTLHSIFTQQCGPIPADERKIYADHPYSIRALQFLVDLYDAMGGIEKEGEFIGSMTMAAMATAFQMGKSAMRLVGGWEVSYTNKYAPEPLDYGTETLPIPRDGRPFNVLGGRGPFILKTSKNVEEAFAFMKWLMEPEQQLEFYRISSHFPSNKKAFKAAMDNPNDPHDVPFMRAIWSNTVKNPGVNIPIGKFYFDLMQRAIDAAVYHKGTPETLLREVQQKAQAELDRFWKAHPDF